MQRDALLLLGLQVDRHAHDGGAALLVACAGDQAQIAAAHADDSIAYRPACEIHLPGVGTGKTKVLQVLAEDMGGWYVYCDEDMSPRSFLEAVCECVGAQPKGKAIPKLKQAIVNRISGSGRPLFLDETHLLRPHVFSRIRSLHDRTQCPVIMAGADEILTRIDDRANGRGQLRSRCITYNAMEYVSNVEAPDGGKKLGRPLFSRQEIRDLFEHMPIKLTDGALEMVWALACLPGHGCLQPGMAQ